MSGAASAGMRLRLADRVATGLRYLVITAILVGGVGVAGRLLYWPLLTSTIGPTAYVFAANP